MAELGHVVFSAGRYNLNIAAVRAPARAAGAFDDVMLVWCQSPAVELAMACTTDPGLEALRNPTHPRGVARLIPGQYRGAWRVGQHKGYPALVQAKPLRAFGRVGVKRWPRSRSR